ncbi:hypothetical protein ENHYDAX1_280002 [Enhydrobacter sp. AX1]|nr:hypothetical protein ENHYDAX1_280002 [Enhydrobacter sp. AX1]
MRYTYYPLGNKRRYWYQISRPNDQFSLKSELSTTSERLFSLDNHSPQQRGV